MELNKTENCCDLVQLSQRLVFKSGERYDLKLSEEGRQLVFKGDLRESPEGADIRCYLFDHALLLARVKMVNNLEQLEVYRKVSSGRLSHFWVELIWLFSQYFCNSW
jgi:hypothetical protein